MKSESNKLTVDVIGVALEPRSAFLEQLCADWITPFFAIDQTARTGP